MSKSYDPHAIETRIYETWEQAGYFAPCMNAPVSREAGSRERPATGRGAPLRHGSGQAYCIMIPPPNVTGSLHMGHAFQDTLMDTLIRYHRMQGDNTLWQAGTDHAGIATQMVVERQLEAEGKTRHDLGREEFVKRIWQWKAESGGAITRQLRRMGASLDWSRERFTMDEGLSHAVTEVFVRLHEEGLIYRGQRLVNWDPVLHTAVSDLEVVSEEEAGHLWHIRYPIAGNKEYLVVATTRPETMLGDTAVAVHPEDERYEKFVGKLVELPLTGRKIPVIADEYVDKEFGSGCVKITPAHDFNDYEVGKRHNLPLINIFYSDAGINLPDSPYHNLDRFKARKKIVADLEAQGLLERVQDHKLMVPRGDRTGAVIEPFLTDQWYVKVGPLAQEAIQCVEDGRIKFVPENWTKTYYEWMRNIQDWCISRQIWWGHRIPAWYDADGNVYVARHAAEAHALARKKHGQDIPLEQDEDVLDTWFSSALWPFSTLGWPEKTKELKTFYPTSVLVTGFDIIFFWVARMIMMGLKFMDKVPFEQVYITGLIRDAHGQKMSKSKGNILDPIDLIDGIDLEALVTKRTSGLMQPQMAKRIEQATRKEFPHGIPAYGTDALRFTMASLATQGRDIKFDLGRIDGYRNFCNKLWNAARFVLMNTEGQDCGMSGAVELNAADRWIVSRQQEIAAEVESAFREYRFDLASQAIYSFIWHEYCDWYLELSKVVLTDTNSRPEQLRGTRRTLVQVLETALRLLHPIMPFITEEVWQRVAKLAGKTGATVMREPYPRPEKNLIDTGASEEMRWTMAVITGVRNVRGEMDISPGKPLPLLFQDGSPADKKYLEANRPYLAALARAESITWLDKGREAPESATALVGHMKVLVPLGSLIDKQAELERLGKEMEKIEKDLSKAKTKLANPDFVARAPKNVVEQEESRVRQFETALVNLRNQHSKVEALPG
ncbi:MAG: valine--tRNA ligase [Candidatus Muproteobacteria bacterium RIFCSPLOWO2_01_FULL_60_18]|uniref:Valine--tRNA ligase n=1 Tax=Candidatus Muproteobacteria bacterium RIFCSPLOWO2_01_FULL_60_18 TaxID=1817768 RepID=A0A1F6U359_9PROT|nr:MAG: valine--tRNA ligase [Candidatus Muproteobacteria bacterium RIFCSPLOWO2_01_FULL_60_18]